MSQTATPTFRETFQRLTDHQQKIRNGENKVSPGETAYFTDAFVPNVDGISQGDVDLVLVDKVPDGYTLRDPKLGTQIAPGNTRGSRHHVVIDDVNRNPLITDEEKAESTGGLGFQIFDPPGWSPTYDELNGPVVVAHRETTIGHVQGGHGPVVIQPGQIVECRFARVWEEEEKRARRNQD